MTTDAHFKKLKFKADVRLELGNNEAIKQAVIGGLGLAVLSKYSLADRTDKDDVAILKKKLNIQSVSNLPFVRFHQDIQIRILGAIPGDVIKIHSGI
jgi:DNA-binding transcriptional LysR family regulator